MTATVRCYTHAGMISAPVSSYGGQKSENAVWLLRQPYIATDTLSCDTSNADSSAEGQFDSANSCLLKVEVQNGKRVHYEITPNGQTLRVATSASPTVIGEETMHFGPGWRISVLEAS